MNERQLVRAACLLPALLGALALAGCNQQKEEEEVTYEVPVKDLSGGEFVVRQPQPGEVPVDVPDIPMKPVRDAEGASAGDNETAALPADKAPADNPR